VGTERSTLFTSPVSFADFVFRLAFFATAPFVVVVAAQLFPVTGALLDVAVAIIVFFMAETIRRWTSRSKFMSWLLSEYMAFERYYRERPPRPFIYYLLYPLLFPYWLINREARREFLMFRGYTFGAFLLLVGTLIFQYFARFRPELGWREFLVPMAITFVAETLLILSLLMPLATTVVWYHLSFRRRRLMIVLLTGFLSTCVAIAYVMQHRDPIVSFITRERVRLRTAKIPKKAHRTMLDAARVAWRETIKVKQLEGDGKVDGPPLEKAREVLERFYKRDEAFAFDLWAAPRKNPRILVLYFEGARRKEMIWVAIGPDGREIRSPNALPPGSFRAMRHAADGSDPLLTVWPKDVDLPGP